MFTRGIHILIGSAVDPGNIPVPRPCDALSEACAQAAQRAMQAGAEYLSPLERMARPDAYARIQHRRREQLESLIWSDASEAVLERVIDLVLSICEEPNWSADGAELAEPGHPPIDAHAAETGMLLAWVMHRHGKRLRELCPRLAHIALDAVRRRLLGPALAHDDYPFMRRGGCMPALVLSDLLLICLLMEPSPARRQQPVKLLLGLLSRVSAAAPDSAAPLAHRLADACALADLARLLKRLTRGEMDLTREQPSRALLDDILISWAGGGCFLDPGGEGMQPPIPGIDVFRLGYLSRSKPLCALGAQLHQSAPLPSLSLNGRVLSMEYMRAAEDELSPAPRLRRAQSADGGLMLSRMEGLLAALTRGGGRANAGDIYLFADSQPLIGDAGGALHSLPMMDDLSPLLRPAAPLPTDADFSNERDLMSIDLTDAYPEGASLAAYQRTLMTMRSDGSVRLVDAFEFMAAPQRLLFRFVCLQKPISLRDHVRIGGVSLIWDGGMIPEVTELDGGAYLLSFALLNPPRRLICGFSFERS